MNTLVQKTIDENMARMLSDGVNHTDLTALRTRILIPEDWCDAWMEQASRHRAIAEAALARGHRLTAGEALWRAALYCHFGQGYFTDDRPQKKLEAERRKQADFASAAGLLCPALERLDVPFRGTTLPGYLRLPHDVRKPPCVVLFGGLDTTKEDALALSNVLIERGLATFAFDGPGQGEVFYRQKLIPDFEQAVSAAIDAIVGRPEIDRARIGVIGRSTGGHWACKVAARDRRVAAAVAWGLMYDVRNLAGMPPTVQARFLRAGGLSSLTEAIEFYRTFDLAGIAAEIACPLMIVQGGRDPLAAPGSAERVAREAKGPVELLLFPESGHCAHDQWHIIKPAMADFLVDRLRDLQ